MSILALFATVALIAGASASKFCCGPEKYSAGTLAKTYIDGNFYQATGEIYYDYTAGLLSSFVNVTIDEYKGVFSLVSTLHDTNSGLVYTMTGGICTKTILNTSLMKENVSPHCIPKTATFDSSFTFGGPHEEIELERYFQKVPNGQRQLAVSKNHCYTVQETIFVDVETYNGSHLKTASMITLTNLKLTVDDPSVFVVPDMCKNSVMSTKRNHDKNLPVDPWKFVSYLAAF